MSIYRFDQSQAMFKRAATVIPCGIYGHFSPAPLVPPTAYPFYTAKAEGSRFWDVDGNEFIDYMCAYGPMVLGYNRPEVDEAAGAKLPEGICCTGASPRMVELAELLVSMIDGMDWAFFAKGGGDVTNFATMIARDATGRRKIVMIQGGYHGVLPWMQAPGHHGMLDEDSTNIIRIPWNDITALEKVIAENPSDVAGFIATPYHVPTFAGSVLPADGYWQKVETICRREGIVLIVDDIRHGFRLNLSGSHNYYSFNPDMVCFCKALANGYPISALMGTDAMKVFASRIFYTGSYWFQAAPMAAALKTLALLKSENGVEKMQAVGERLAKGLVKLAANHGYNLAATGEPSMLNVRITDDESMMLHQEWCAQATLRGAYFTPHHNWFVSAAHTEEDIDQTLDIADAAFAAVREIYKDKFTGQ